jgi:hypothetical protein
MKRKEMPSAFITTLAVITTSSILTAGAAAAGKEKVLFKFNGKDGAAPIARLTFDPAGNIFGVTEYGGSDSAGCFGYGCGTAFKLTRRPNGKWSERVLHSFDTNGSPTGAVVVDTAGNLYGTDLPADASGLGRVFELTPRAKGKWKVKFIHRFGGNDGAFPLAGVISDAKGNLYGTTAEGGAHQKCWDSYYQAYVGCGVVFELTPGPKGTWKETVLHSVDFVDGFDSWASLTVDAAGNLYGTTALGGTGQCTDSNGVVIGCGLVFKLTPDANGKWRETVLHSFQNTASTASTRTATWCQTLRVVSME